ncbi:MAG TPA: thermonuclease family protein [Rhodocyclaceae bacterium]|nr:thermonuclease family protein [Rhodocyclaceae bacterium]
MHANQALRILLAAALLLLSAAAGAEAVEGRVTWVDDGDSFVMILDGGREARVRIAGIDAPERRQPYSRVARRHLEEMVKDRRVTVAAYKTDVYDRLVGPVRANGRDVGLAQIEAGLAWHDVRRLAEQPADEARTYAGAESAARSARRGLWAWSAPVPPWEWRARQR